MKCRNCNLKLKIEKLWNGILFICPNEDYAEFQWVDPDKIKKRKGGE